MRKKYYTIDEEPKSTHWLKVLIILLLFGLFLGVFFIYKASRPSSQPVVQAPTQETPAHKENTKIEGRYLFHGTLFWGRGVEQKAIKTGGGIDFSQPFSGLNTFTPEKYDAWVADLECPTSVNHIPFRTQVDQLIFNCRPDFLPEVSKYFQFLNLSNNHSGDRGVPTFNETREALTKNGIQHFGHPDASATDDACEVVSLPIKITNDASKKGNIPVAFCAWHYFFRTPVDGEIETMKKYAEVMPVFAFVHMGVEYQPKAGQQQRDIAHKVIDSGADFVIANNPHWVQDSEAYNGKLIVYSTGNFIFDQLEPEEQRSASVDLTINLEDKNLDEWIKIGESCKTFKDTCLEQIQLKKLKKMSPTYNFDIVAGVGGYTKITQLGNAQVQAAVKERLNWAETLKGLR